MSIFLFYPVVSTSAHEDRHPQSSVGPYSRKSAKAKQATVQFPGNKEKETRNMYTFLKMTLTH